MSPLLWVLAIVVVLVAALLVIAATRPDTFRLQRRIVIDAPPEQVFPLINDLHAHESWNPFDTPDPAATKLHSGAPHGTGAVYDWSGKGRSGTGRLSILQSIALSRIVMQLDLLVPFKASNAVEFTLLPTDTGTDLSWSMQGPLPYPARIMHTLFKMDRMVGSQFETGLRNLKTIIERNR